MSKQLINGKKISSKTWLYISVGATLVCGVGYWLLLTTTNTYDARRSLDLISVWSPLVLLMLVVSMIISITAMVKAEAWYKLIPIALVLMNAAFFVLTLLAYALSA
jgi:hypothetical protein